MLGVGGGGEGAWNRVASTHLSSPAATGIWPLLRLLWRRGREWAHNWMARSCHSPIVDEAAAYGVGAQIIWKKTDICSVQINDRAAVVAISVLIAVLPG